MGSLKRQKISASILLEALTAMAVFAAIVSLLLGQIRQSRKEQSRLLREGEILRLAKMALQTGQDTLSANGITVRQVKTDRELTVYHEGEVVLNVQKR
ncbi:competence type IV pilus minor pilin ComGE [Streptococcus panodentis]|uniref:competence type IV pilus minor pilin ComGE n=1 Tax=Streptococcus panodentis TaxID=1581472 RepID=UPI001AEB0B88|nr:competence type IV pilus minor pilin ComGE [Streptococcus panodentis]